MAKKATPKKLTAKEKQVLTGLHSLYITPGDSLTIAGDDKNSKIGDKAIMEILSGKTQLGYDKFKEDTQNLAKQLGLKLELKVIVKLT